MSVLNVNNHLSPGKKTTKNKSNPGNSYIMSRDFRYCVLYLDIITFKLSCHVVFNRCIAQSSTARALSLYGLPLVTAMRVYEYLQRPSRSDRLSMCIHRVILTILQTTVQCCPCIVRPIACYYRRLLLLLQAQ